MEEIRGGGVGGRCCNILATVSSWPTSTHRVLVAGGIAGSTVYTTYSAVSITTDSYYRLHNIQALQNTGSTEPCEYYSSEGHLVGAAPLWWIN